MGRINPRLPDNCRNCGKPLSLIEIEYGPYGVPAWCIDCMTPWMRERLAENMPTDVRTDIEE